MGLSLSSGRPLKWSIIVLLLWFGSSSGGHRGGCHAFMVVVSEEGRGGTMRMPITTDPAAAVSSNQCRFKQRWRHSSSSTTRRYFFNFGKNKEEEQAAADAPVEKEEKQKQQGEEEPDFAENVFSFFFGKPEEEPMGLKRFGKERFPEQYPATVDTWADPVASDDREMALVRPVLKNTNLEERKLQCTYAASRNGWNAAAFHKCVDKKGGGLVVCTTKDGLLCGGYNPKGWVSYGEARGSIAAFLFRREKPDGTFRKLRKVGGPGLAQLDYPESGPSFGADSLVIPLQAGQDNPRRARSKLGSYYERWSDGTDSLFGPKTPSVLLSELKVYQGVYEPGEFIPHTDAEPFALY